MLNLQLMVVRFFLISIKIKNTLIHQNDKDCVTLIVCK